MAERKSPHVDPIVDGSSSGSDDSLIVHVLPQPAFNSIIRGIKNSKLEVSNAVVAICFAGMQRLGEMPDMSEAVKGTPLGSDCLDLGTFRTWVEKIKADDDDSIAQLIAIHATAKTRLNS